MGKGGFYAVERGRSVGVYLSWDECNAQVKGFPNARFKKFSSNDEAENFILKNSGVVPIGQFSSTAPAPTAVGSTGSGISVKSSLYGGTAIKSDSVTVAKQNSFPEPSLKYNNAQPGASSSKTKVRNTTARKTVLLDQIQPSNPSTRSFSTSANLKKRSLKVTEDRIINKRPRQEEANSKTDLNSFTVDEEGYVVIFTDGACKANGRRGAKAGIGVWFGNNHPLNISEPVRGRQTNNTAEIQAAERAILQAKEQGLNKVNIKTDSQFTINCITKWMWNWKKNNWKLSNGEDVKNKVDLEKLDKAMNLMEIKWSYVAGHKGHHGNEEADRLAVLGSEKIK